MITCVRPTFAKARDYLRACMKTAPSVRTERWQGMDVSKRPDAVTYELQNVFIEVPLAGSEDLNHWRKDIVPNLPWADDHFEERIGGEPLNPGEQWKNWPWAISAERFREGEEQKFNHTYMERYWPKFAGSTPGINHCLGRPVGDMGNLVRFLAREPATRQAWIPIFHPQDTGFADGGRKPCTLGYQFLVRGGALHIWYPLRSCDLIRHYSDDVYLTVRLLLWVLDKCRKIDPGYWDDIIPGTYAMFCTSLHIFENDKRTL